MNKLEKCFRTRLIPLVQLLHLLAFSHKRNRVRSKKALQALSRSIEALNLVSCALMTSHRNPSDEWFGLLEKGLSSMQQGALGVLSAAASEDGRKGCIVLNEAVKRGMPGPFNLTTFEKSIGAPLRGLAIAEATLWNAIGYHPNSRQDWVRSRIENFPSNPLIPKGKLGYWRTLAFNSDWLELANILTPYGRLDVKTLFHHFSSQVGAARQATLMADAFDDLRNSQAENCQGDAPVLLPAGVTLSSRMDGLLVVCYRKGLPVPEATLKEAVWDVFMAEHSDASSLIIPTSKSWTIGLDKLFSVLEEAKRLSDTKARQDEEVMARFENFKVEWTQRQLMDKLTKAFSPEELDILRGMLVSR
jgi:hypothetical protein